MSMMILTDSMFFKQTSDTTGVSCASIKRLQKRHLIMMELFLNSNKEIWLSRCLLLDDFDHEKIYHLYQAKEDVTLAKLLVVLKDNKKC